MTRYEQGFMNKCAEYGVNPQALARWARARGMQKRAQSMEERYPQSIAFRDEALERIRNGEATDYDRNLATMTPEEISADMGGLTMQGVLRGTMGSIDEDPETPGKEFMRDPRFMSPNQRFTPAGTNLLNSIIGRINWEEVDGATGAGQGFHGRNIPFPPGFLYDTAPTNSTMKIEAPSKR